MSASVFIICKHCGRRHPVGEECPPAQSWAPVDLGPYLRGEVAETKPTALRRDDGQHILYPGLVTWVSGESESLKSWLVQVAMAEQLKAGKAALYLDFESDPLPVVQRLLALGVEVPAIGRRLIYIRPEEPLPEASSRLLLALLDERRPAISCLDGVNAAMGVSGLDANLSKDIYRWLPLVRAVQRATSGPTLVVDHVVKDPGQRGRYAIGSVSKLALVDGAHLGMELVDPFGRGMTGKAIVRLHKDRPGWLRGAADKDVLASLELTEKDGKVTSSLAIASAASKGAQKFRPTTLMERVSAHVQQAGTPLSQNAICEAVKGKRAALIQAIHVLAEEGYLAAEDGPRCTLYRFVRAYSELEDLAGRASSSGNVPPGNGNVPPPGSPPGGGEPGNGWGTPGTDSPPNGSRRVRLVGRDGGWLLVADESGVEVEGDNGPPGAFTIREAAEAWAAAHGWEVAA